MIVIGIDPGVMTGLAVWSVTNSMLTIVESMLIHQAIRIVEARQPELVIFEDARLRNWFGSRGDRNAQKYGAGVREGVGSVKRDCKIWEDYLRELAVPFIARKPQAGSTKWSAAQFKAITKWPQRTNNHARDAAALVYGLELQQVRSLVQMRDTPQ